MPKSKPLVDGRHELAKKLFVVDSARLVLADDHEDLTFDGIFLANYAMLKLGQSQERVHLHITNTSFVSPKATLDFSETEWVGIYPGENATDTIFGNIFFKEFIGIQGKNVDLIGKIDLGPNVKDSYRPLSKVVVTAGNVTLYGTAEIRAGYTLLQANATLTLLEGSRVASLVENTCNVDVGASEVFSCFASNSLQTELTADSIREAYKTQFSTTDNQTDFSTVLTGLRRNYTAYLVSYGRIKMFETYVNGPRIGICTVNLTLFNTAIDTSGQGCPSDSGLARGRQAGRCAGSGGSNFARGGFGSLLVEPGENAVDLVDCSQHVPEPNANLTRKSNEGSGGASGPKSQGTGGAGGGIIRVHVLDTMVADGSQILANGLSGQ